MRCRCGRSRPWSGSSRLRSGRSRWQTSSEVDVLPIVGAAAETCELADKIEGVAGEWSPFHKTHAFYIDGVDLSTSILPSGWQERLIKVQNANTAGIDGTLQLTGRCLDKEDLCVAKPCAFREKDTNFVGALLETGLVDAALILSRLDEVPSTWSGSVDRARRWIGTRSRV